MKSKENSMIPLGRWLVNLACGLALSGCSLDQLPLPDWALAMLGQAPAQEAAPAPRPRPAARRRRKDGGGTVVTAVASDGAMIEMNPQVLYRAYATRNMAFDRMRTEALLLIDQGRTTEAVALLEKARAARPDDATIPPLLELARRPPDLPAMPDGMPPPVPDARGFGGGQGADGANKLIDKLIGGKQPDVPGGLGAP
jgi:hypothetical protein